jgi:hypothetical protein
MLFKEIKPYNFRNELSNNMTAVMMEDMNCQSTQGIKFKIPLLMPEIPEMEPMESKQKVSTSHIVNKNKVEPEEYETSNYVLLNVAQEFAFMCPRDEGDTISKGQEFIITCMDGELANIRVIGRNF